PLAAKRFAMKVFLSVVSFVGFLIFCFSIYPPKHKPEPNPLFWIENASITSPNIRVTIDEAVIFDGEAHPVVEVLPAIMFGKDLDLPPGQHTIRFDDPSRGITEVKTFNTPETRTISVTMEEDVLDHEHIHLYDELVYPA